MEDMVGRRIDSLVMRHCAVASKVKRCHGLEAVDGSLNGLNSLDRTPMKHASRQGRAADWVLFLEAEYRVAKLNLRTQI